MPNRPTRRSGDKPNRVLREEFGRERASVHGTVFKASVEALFDRWPDAVLTCDDDRIVTWANRVACAVLGKPREEIVGQSFSSFTDSHHRAQIEGRWREFMKVGHGAGRWRMVGTRGVHDVDFTAVANFLPGVHLACCRDVSEFARRAGEVKRLNRELEVRVAERTAELELLNLRLREDIRERRMAAVAIRESERRYRRVFQSASDAILIVDLRSLKILEANQQALRMYGFKRSEFIGMKMHRISPALFYREPLIKRLSHAGHLPLLLTDNRRKDGSPVTVAIKESVIDFGGVPALISIQRDVTVQRRTEQALRQSEERLRTAMEAGLDAFFIFEAVRDSRRKIVDFRFVDMNRRAAALLALKRDRMIGQSISRLFPVARSGGFIDRFAEVVRTGRPLVEEFAVQMPTVRARWLHQQVVRLNDGVAVTARDITGRVLAEQARKASEERLRMIFEHEPECVKIVSADGRLLDMNPAGLKMIGAESGEEVIGTPVMRLIHPEHRREFGKLHRHCLLGGTGQLEFRIVGLKGSVRWLETHSVPMKTDDGTITSVLSVTRDVTSRRLVEEAQRLLPKRILSAQEAERRRVARDLHDGVGQLLASAQFRLKSVAGGAGGTHGMLRRQLENAARAVEDALREVRRISHGLRPSELDDLGLAAAVRRSAEDFGTRTGMRIDLRLQTLPERPAGAAELALFRIFQESLTNIERHARAGRVRVGLAWRRHGLELRVADDGRGFSQARTHGHGRRRAAGAGLLNMSERVAMLGGTFECASGRGKGTSVRAWVPLGSSNGNNNDGQT